MQCKNCKSNETIILETRLDIEDNSVRRRRECQVCGLRFTTIEVVKNAIPKKIEKKCVHSHP